jgi:hypothetical protein
MLPGSRGPVRIICKEVIKMETRSKSPRLCIQSDLIVPTVAKLGPRAMLRLPAYSLIAVCVSLTGMTGRAETGVKADHGWQGLLDDSPFGTPPLVNPPAAGLLEFRGFVREDGELWVNLYDPMSKRSEWCSVPGSPASGLKVESYDPATDHLVIQQAGRRLSLALRLGRVVLPANIAPLVITAPMEPAAPGEDERETFIRQLPPEARQMLETVRRQRIQRVPQTDALADLSIPGASSRP